MSFKAEAAAIAALGYKVFPCANPLTDTADVGKKGKRPLTENGVSAATTDMEQLAIWAAKFPDAIGIDIRCGNSYVIAPPSLHENGSRYQWQLPLVSPEKLAPIPQLWIEKFLPKREKAEYNATTAPIILSGIHDIDDCQRYVDTIEPILKGIRNNSMYRIASIIFWDFGLSENDGFPILQYFNQTKVVPPLSEAEIVRAMNSAMELDHKEPRGFRCRTAWEAPKQKPGVDISAITDGVKVDTVPQVMTEPKTVKLPEPLPKRLLHVPGFIEQVSQFTLSAAPQAQPTMALVGALAAQSVLIARKVCSADSFRPSLYLLALAETGTGKDYPRAVNQHILESVGMGSYIPEKCASGEGLEDAIIAKGMLLLQTDEINFTFSNMALKNESRWSKLESVILELYSCTHKSYTGRLKANMCGKVVDPPKVFEPGLSIFGTATPSRFCGSLTFEMIEGGLASRCIVLECEPRKYTQRQRELSSMPTDVIEIARHWADFVPVHPVTGKPGNISGTAGAPQRLVIPFTPQSDERMLDFRKYCDEQIMSLSKQKQPIEAALWTRVYENAGRLAVNYACSQNHLHPIIDIDTVQWASEFAVWTAENMTRMVRQNVAENPFHAMSLRVQSLIRKNGGKITHTQLMRSSHLSSKQLKDVIDTLLEAGIIVRNFVDTGGRPIVEYVLVE